MPEIRLTRGRVAVVSDEDYERASAFKWYAGRKTNSGRWYACRSRDRMKMHRFIMGAPPGVQVDHRDGDGLNNRRDNLRLASQSQNSANAMPRKGRTLPKGVWADRGRPGWYRSEIEKDGRRLVSPRFREVETAARWYADKARELHGEFARTHGPV